MLFYLIAKFSLLLKILDCRAEHLNVILADNIFIQSVADTFGVTHLADYATVGRGNTLDGEGRVVGVESNIACRVAV